MSEEIMDDIILSNKSIKAFVSCSLRNEDREFVNYVESILRSHNIEPFGTVGKYEVAPKNPAESMKENIPNADVVVIIATQRYFQVDISTGQESYGLSEMVHAETGMAYALGKPVLVFVQDGTSVGNFLPNITQYIVLNGTHEDYNYKKNLITSLFTNAIKAVDQIKNGSIGEGVFKVSVGLLAIFGLIKLFEGSNAA